MMRTLLMLLMLLLMLPLTACDDDAGGTVIDLVGSDSADAESEIDTVEVEDAGELAEVEDTNSCGACCDADCLCAGDARCVGDVCKEIPEAGRCWDSEDCGPEQRCLQASLCPCGAPCAEPDQLGVCVDNDSCCVSSPIDSCGDHAQCRGAGVDAICYDNLDEGKCWENSDCGANEACDSPMICHCFDPCISIPGECVAEQNNCEELSENCCSEACPCTSFSEKCVYPDDSGVGVCQELAGEQGACWDGADCEFGQPCVGVSICPCDQDCTVEDHPGLCMGLGGACCDLADANSCPEGSRCLEVDGTPTCHAELGSPYCWEDSDCAADQSCAEVSLCNCLVDCISQPGMCIDKEPSCEDLGENCCSDACPCSNWSQECVYPDGESTGVCLGLPELANDCWSAADCDYGQPCIDANICPCGQDCTVENQTGQCMALGGACCDLADATSCPEGSRCLEVDGTPTCHAELAQPYCWQDSDCANGESCTDVSLCNCMVDCISEPGVCK